MCLIFSFIPATMFLAVGFLVLAISNKSEGMMRTLGLGLAIWVFIVSAFFPICGAYVTFSGICPMDQMLQQMEEGTSQ